MIFAYVLFGIMVALAITLVPLCITYFKEEKKFMERQAREIKKTVGPTKPTSFVTRDADRKYPFHRGHRYTNEKGVGLKRIWTSKKEK